MATSTDKSLASLVLNVVPSMAVFNTIAKEDNELYLVEEETSEGSYTKTEVDNLLATKLPATVAGGNYNLTYASIATVQTADVSLLRNSKLVSADDTTQPPEGEIYWTVG